MYIYNIGIVLSTLQCKNNRGKSNPLWTCIMLYVMIIMIIICIITVITYGIWGTIHYTKN